MSNKCTTSALPLVDLVEVLGAVPLPVARALAVMAPILGLVLLRIIDLGRHRRLRGALRSRSLVRLLELRARTLRHRKVCLSDLVLTLVEQGLKSLELFLELCQGITQLIH